MVTNDFDLGPGSNVHTSQAEGNHAPVPTKQMDTGDSSGDKGPQEEESRAGGTPNHGRRGAETGEE